MKWGDSVAWSFNDRTVAGTKHFRGLSTDADITDEKSLELSNEKLRNGDEAYYIDTQDVKIYRDDIKYWEPQ